MQNEDALTYEQLVQAAEKAATRLDVSSGLVFLSLPNGPEWLIQALACWLAGACLVPQPEEWERTAPAAISCPPGDIVALACRSSGSTGAPKLFPHRLSRLLRLADALVARLELDSEDRSLWCLPGFSPFILTSQILPCLLAGGCLLVQTRFQAPSVAQALFHKGVTRTYLYPSQYSALLDYAGTSHQLRSCVTGGDLCPVSLHRAFEERFAMGIFQSMGTSETLAYSINTSPRLDKKGSAGLPIGECRVRIGEDDSSPVGEIQVWQPDLDWHATGDSGMLDAEGYLWYLGREGYHGGDPLRWRSQLEEINGWVEVQEAALLGKSAFLVVQNQCHWPEILQRLALLELQGNFLSEMPRVAGGKTDLLALARLLLR